VKEQLDAEYQVLEAIEEAFEQLTLEKPIQVLVKDGLMRSRDWKTKEIVARVLGVIGDRRFIKDLVKALKVKDARVRTSILLTLGEMRAEEVSRDVVKMLDDKDWMVRSAAIEALRKIRDPKTFEALLAQMEKEEGLLAEDCAEALGSLTGEDFGRSVEAWRKWWAEHGEAAIAGGAGDAKPPEPEKPDSSEDGRYYHKLRIKSRRTIFIIDVSESMSYSNEEFQKKPEPGETSRLDLAKRELRQVIQDYDPKGTFGLIAFHTVVKVWRPRIVPATPVMKGDAREWVEDRRATGTTNIYAALETAFRMAGMGITDKYYAPAADTIYLLSDGAPTNRDLSDDDTERILRAVREWNRIGRMRIHTIGLKGHDREFMRRLAQENGGTYISRED
jgi:hypothetical protein